MLFYKSYYFTNNTICFESHSYCCKLFSIEILIKEDKFKNKIIIINNFKLVSADAQFAKKWSIFVVIKKRFDLVAV